MLRVVYSNCTEELLAALCRDLEEARGRPGASLFAKTHLVLPDRHVESYLKLGIARLTGLCANLEVHYLKRFFTDLFASSSVRVVDTETLQAQVLSVLLDDERLGHHELQAARDYVHDVTDESAVDVRRYQLSVKLARLFEEYGLARPDMLEAWRRDQLSTGPDAAPTEQLQRRIWSEVFGKGGLLERHAEPGVRWITFADLVGPRSAEYLAAVSPPERVYVFGFSYMATTFIELLAALAQKIDMLLYAPCPCHERQRAQGDAAKRLAVQPDGDPFGLLAETTPALRRWARPGREHLRLLDAVPGAELRPARPDQAADSNLSLLHQLQRDILEREEERDRPEPGFAFAGDPTVTVLGCPSIRREAEIVANQIWDLVLHDRSLRFHEIAVIVAGRDQAAYLTHLAAALRECHDIPHSVADLPLRSASRVVEAVELLLALPFGTYTRQDLLRLATHPAVMRRHFPEASAEDWIAWCADLGIVHGADHTDHAQTYIQHDILNWDQGMRRLALGAFMAGDRSGEERTFTLGGERYAPKEVGDPASAAQFALLVRALVADAQNARSARHTLAEWADVFTTLVTTYVGFEGADEERELLGCVRSLQGLADVGLGDRAVSYRIAHELAHAAITGLGASRGQAFADGVVVSSFRPMRALPFKVVFVVGFGEGEFPAPESRDHLDLRGAARRVGDVTPRERDKYMFLETLLSTRQRLHLSYICRDPLTGEDLQPSSVLLELMQVLQQGYLGLSADDMKKWVVKHPLRRYDERYFPDLFPPGKDGGPPLPSYLPEARREAQTVALAASLRARGNASLLADRQALAAHLPERVRAHLRLIQPPAAPELGVPQTDQAAVTLRVSLTALRRFLECPLQGYASFVLGLGDEEADVFATEDEAFAMAFPEKIGFLRRVIVDALVHEEDPLVEYERQAAVLELGGALPTGPFGDVERAAQRECLATWLDLIPRAARGALPKVETVRFGGAQEHAVVDQFRDPVVLDLPLTSAPGLPPRVRVEITGKTEALIEERQTSLLFSVRGSATEGQAQAKTLKEALRGFLDHVMLSASGEGAGKSHTALVCLQGEGGTVPVTFKAFADKVEACTYLGKLTTILLTRPHDYLLPCEAVFWHSVAAGKLTLTECVEKVLKWPFFSTKYGPIKSYGDYPVPPEDVALDIVNERLGLFFAQLETSSAAPEANATLTSAGTEATAALKTRTKASAPRGRGKKGGRA